MPAALKITLTKLRKPNLTRVRGLKNSTSTNKTQSNRIASQFKGMESQSDAFGYASQIADYLECAESTVRQTIHRWNKRGLGGLWEAKGRGRKPRWTKEDWQVLEQWLNEPHSSSARQLSQRLAKERQVSLGAETCSSSTQKAVRPRVFLRR